MRPFLRELASIPSSHSQRLFHYEQPRVYGNVTLECSGKVYSSTLVSATSVTSSASSPHSRLERRVEALASDGVRERDGVVISE
jgi:hypothetical protein